jgi:hypothetical protein
LHFCTGAREEMLFCITPTKRWFRGSMILVPQGGEILLSNTCCSGEQKHQQPYTLEIYLDYACYHAGTCHKGSGYQDHTASRSFLWFIKRLKSTVRSPPIVNREQYMPATTIILHIIYIPTCFYIIFKNRNHVIAHFLRFCTSQKPIRSKHPSEIVLGLNVMAKMPILPK